MKNILLLFLLVSTLNSFSETLNKVAENTVSNTTKVFTFKVVTPTTTTLKDNDGVVLPNNSEKEIINYFLSIEGVTEANFDKATNTYTVTSKIETTISDTLTL